MCRNKRANFLVSKAQVIGTLKADKGDIMDAINDSLVYRDIFLSESL